MAPPPVLRYVDIGIRQPADGELCYIIRHPWYSAPIKAQYQIDHVNATAFFKFQGSSGEALTIPFYNIYKWRSVI